MQRQGIEGVLSMAEIAVMGYGTVGSGVVEVLDKHADSIAGRAKEQIQIKYILDLKDFPGSRMNRSLQNHLIPF
jgi:homoserine dehydrogenase